MAGQEGDDPTETAPICLTHTHASVILTRSLISLWPTWTCHGGEWDPQQISRCCLSFWFDEPNIREHRIPVCMRRFVSNYPETEERSMETQHRSEEEGLYTGRLLACQDNQYESLEGISE